MLYAHQYVFVYMMVVNRCFKDNKMSANVRSRVI